MHATDVLGLDAQSFAVRAPIHPSLTRCAISRSTPPGLSCLGSESSAHEKAADGSNCGVYLNARLNEPSASGRGTSSSLVSKSKWASATSGLSSEGKYLGSTDVSFYSAQEILEGDADSPAEPVISKDFIITPDHESADEPSTQAKSSPQGPDATDQSNSDEKLITSSANVSTDESFQCRGLSQITPNSLSQPSDQQSSQPSDEETHQPTDKGSPQSSDQDPPQPTQQELSERRDPKSLRMKTTRATVSSTAAMISFRTKPVPNPPAITILRKRSVLEEIPPSASLAIGSRINPRTSWLSG
ncbi:hypothetical protein H4Q26_006384 [Puccinia striiformis f. sp. tritici PST-130]|nr:hypothetical protein H4Q26_006384 [Puccinia striiformis f. sp. tritici PST-130]